MSSCIDKIKLEYASMSDVEKRIADYILHSAERAVNATVAQVAEGARVSDGSVVRFANKLGFDGFTRLKIELAKSLPADGGVLFGGVGDHSSVKSVMEGLFSGLTYSVRSTIDAADGAALEATAAVLAGSRRIEIYGVGSSSMIAMDAYYRLLRIGLPVYAVTDPHIAGVSASLLGPGCTAIGISYSGKTTETLRAMKIAKERGAATVGLTAFSGSPLAELCGTSHIVVAKETESLGEATAARLTQLLIFDSLCLYISRQREGSLEVMENVIDIIGEHRK